MKSYYIVVSTVTLAVSTYDTYADMIADIQRRGCYSFRVLYYSNGEYQQLDHSRFMYT